MEWETRVRRCRIDDLKLLMLLGGLLPDQPKDCVSNFRDCHVFALLQSKSNIREEKQGCLFQFLESLAKRKTALAPNSGSLREPMPFWVAFLFKGSCFLHLIILYIYCVRRRNNCSGQGPCYARTGATARIQTPWRWFSWSLVLPEQASLLLIASRCCAQTLQGLHILH